MAYNPFNVFRRNQKGLFAVLTVFIMLMFTLSFGNGDFFQWLPSLLGKGSGKGDVVAKIQGKKITDGDLNQITTRRVMASEFMVASIGIAINKLDSYLKESLNTASRDNKQVFLEFLRARSSQVPYLDEQMFQFIRSQAQLTQFIAFTMERQKQQLGSLLNTGTTPKEDMTLAKTAMNLLDLDGRRLFNTSLGYFEHKADGEDSLRAALDFDIWLNMADKLGIRYSEEEARKMYLDEFFGQIDGQSLAEVEKGLFANRTGYSREMIFNALADEFRVRTARSVVLGRRNAPQIFPTPWDAYEFYRKECNGGTYAVFTVPAENYLAKVTGEPSEGELRKLFESYQKKEPDPTKDGIGLREPRKLKLGWLEVQGDEPFYKKLGADTLAASEAQAKIFVAALAPMPGAGFAMISAPAVLSLKDPALAGAYAAYREKYKVDLDIAWFPNFSTSLNSAVPIDSSILKPFNVAAAVGAALGSLGTHGSPLTAPLVFLEKARMEDRAARAKALVPLLTAPTAAGSMLLASSLASAACLPPPLPLAAVRNELIDKVRVEVTKKAIKDDLEHFKEEAAKLGAKPDKAEAKAYIAKFIQERGLKSGGSLAFHDQWSMQEDAGLKPLMEKQERGHNFLNMPIEFGGSFFFAFDAKSQREVPATTLFVPEPFPEGGLQLKDGEPTFLAWRSEELPAETPRDFAKTKPRIMDLWKRLEARKLAAAEAAELAKQVRELAESRGIPTAKQDLTTTSKVDDVIDAVYGKYFAGLPTFAEKDRAERFEITDVAPLSLPERSQFRPAAPPQPKRFQLLPRREIPYPTLTMQQALLANKDGNPATTVVMNEESKDRYYVAVLRHRQERSTFDFYDEVYKEVGQLSNEVKNDLQRSEINQMLQNATALMKVDLKVEILNDKLK